MDDRSSRRRSRQRPPRVDPHARLIADGYDAPRGRQLSPYHNRNLSPARGPTVAPFEDSPSVPSNAPLLAPRPQPLAVAIHEPPMLVKQGSSGGSSSSGSSIQVHQVPRRRNRRSIPPPQPIPVPGAPDYSQPAPPPQLLPQMHDAPMTSYGQSVASGPSPQVAPSHYHHTLPHSSQMSQMYNQPYSPAPPPPPSVFGFGSPEPGAKIEPQGPRDFAKPNHFRYRPKVLTVPTPLAPQNGWTPSSSAAGSVMVMSPPYQAQQLAAPTTLQASYSPVAAPHPPHPSAGPYQSHWRPFTPEPPPPSQLHQQQQMYSQPLPPPQQQQQQQQQQQGWQRGHQYSRSEPPMIEFPPSLGNPSPTTHDGYYTEARRASAEMQLNSNSGRGRELLQPPTHVPPPIQAKPPPPSQRGHAKSMGESGPGKMNASTVARMLQAQRANPANASSTSLNNLPASASSTSLAQQPQPLVPEVRTNTHRPNSPAKLAPPAPADQTQRPPAPPHAQVQPSSRPRVLRRDTPPPPPPQAASAPILIRSNSPAAGPGLSPCQMHPRGCASSEALLEGNNTNSSNSSCTNVGAITATPTGRKISFDVPHGPEQDPPAAAAAPKKRRRARPTNPDDNLLVDPFGFPVVEDTPYDVVERLAGEVSI